MIADLKRNGYNRFVRSAERIVLPRLTEVLEDAADLDECLVAGEILSQLSCDFADAFHNFAVHRGGFLLRSTRVQGMSSTTPSFSEEEDAQLCGAEEVHTLVAQGRVCSTSVRPACNCTLTTRRRTQSPQRVGSLVVVGVFGTAHLVG